MKKRRIHLSTAQFILLGFVGMIIIGSLFLMLPCSTRSGEGASFLDSLFTATSAVCVTGLIVQDTATYWSDFGQAVILFLIQIGGMGIVTIAVAFATMSGRKIGLMQRTVMQEAISAPKLEGIVRLTRFIIKMAFVIELTGAVLMYPVFAVKMGALKGIWYAVFHSISAFCNGGFDLMGINEKYSSLTSFSGNIVINVVIVLLILLGGIGFMTWDDIRTHKFKFSKYRMQSKVILSATIGLIVIPFIYFYFCEFSGAKWHMSGADRALASLFQTVTPRTAGFNTVDLTKVSGAGQLIMIVLMMVGGATGSTAGGMKITTLAVLFASAISVFRRKSSPHLFRRRIAEEVIKSAAAILLLYSFLFLMGGIIISAVDGFNIIDALFESASAVCTVGITLGITPHTGVISRIVLMVLMLFGRVGGLTVIFATVSGKRKDVAKFPEEKIMVG